MKTKLFTLFLAGFFIPQLLSAQDCGDRYTLPIFNQVSVTEDIVFSTNVTSAGATASQKADIYEPEGDTFAKRPLIIFIHGGSFLGGSEDDEHVAYYCDAFAKRGYVTASISYRLLGIAQAMPFILQGNTAGLRTLFFDEVAKAVADSKAAIRFFRQDAATDNHYRIDPDQIFIGGASAGAVTAIHAAYLDREEDFTNYTHVANPMSIIDNNGGFEGDSGNDGYPSNTNAVINFCGAIGSVDFLQPDSQPIVSFHGDADSVVPYASGFATTAGVQIIPMEGSASIKAKMDELGIANALLTFPGGEHMEHDNHRPEVLQLITDFITPMVICNNETVATEQPTLAVENTNLYTYFHPKAHSLELNIENNGSAALFKLAIYDQNGKLIRQLTQQPEGTYMFDMSELPSGMYIATIYNTATHQQLSKKVFVH